MFETILLMALSAFATALYLIISRRRWIPRPDSKLTTMGDIQKALPHIAQITGSALHRGNEATLFQNGKLLEAMLDSIAGAQTTVHLETYVWQKGNFEKRLVNLLCDRAQQGVTVRVLVDAVGARNASKGQMAKLRHKGVELAFYHPVNRFSFRRFNNRNHRKLLIIDGTATFIFGHGIKDVWCGRAQDSAHWRDTGVRLHGPSVASLQSVFIGDWINAQQKIPTGEGCFAEDAGYAGPVAVHVAESTSREEHSSVALLYMLAIACARKEVIIQNPYFATKKSVLTLLEQAVKRGVKVHLMLPGKQNDSYLLYRAGKHLYGRLLRAGVRIYEYEPNMLHQKIVIVDEVWSHIGTTNFDTRSLALNAEVGVGLLDKSIAQELRSAFQQDCKRSHELTFDKWQNRKWYQRGADWAAYQLHGKL